MVEVNIRIPRDHFDISGQTTFGDGITGVFGPSGAGKTSLLLSIAGLLKPQEGEIRVFGKTVFSKTQDINIKAQKRNIGYVFQDGRLFPHMTVKKNLEYGQKYNSNLSINLEELVELLQIRHILDSKPGKISGGEKQRVALGRALMASPEVLLLDEPFVALDLDLRNQIISFIDKIHKKYKVPIVLVSHNLSDILMLTTDILLMNKGRILEKGSVFDLISSPYFTSVFGKQTFVNAFDMFVSEEKGKSGLQVNFKTEKGEIQQVSYKSMPRDIKASSNRRIYIQSNDISLSLNKLDGLSIQNQIPGKISKIVEENDQIICHITNGLDWLVEISKNAHLQMNLQVGMEVYMLFKSTAVSTY